VIYFEPSENMHDQLPIQPMSISAIQARKGKWEVVDERKEHAIILYSTGLTLMILSGSIW